MRSKGQTRLFQGLRLLGISIIPSNLIWVKNSTKLPLWLGYFWQIALKTSLSQGMTWNNENKWRWEGWKCWREKRQLYHSMTFIMRWRWHLSSVHGRMFRYLIVILSFFTRKLKGIFVFASCFKHLMSVVFSSHCHFFISISFPSSLPKITSAAWKHGPNLVTIASCIVISFCCSLAHVLKCQVFIKSEKYSCKR